jgi:hypothetical protein
MKDINLICNNKLAYNNDYISWLHNLKVDSVVIYEIDNIKERKKKYIQTKVQGVSKKNLYIDNIRISKSIGAIKLNWYALNSTIMTLMPYSSIEECYEKRSQDKSDYGYWL